MIPVHIHNPMAKWLFLHLLAAFVLSGCNIIEFRTDEQLLAEVYNNRLYLEDIQGILPAGVSSGDSAAMVKRYVDRWVDQQVYIYHAKQNTSIDKRYLEQRMDNYRNALIIHAFEEDIVRSELDTVVDYDEIAAYYETFSDHFRVRNNLVKVNFVKLPLNAPGSNQIRSLYQTDLPDEMERLMDLSLEHAASYQVDNENWLLFNDILKEMPLNIDDPTAFLRNNRFTEITDDYYRYFLYIHDYRLRGDQSPLNFEYENIRTQILNRRKKEFLSLRKREMHQHAIEGNHIELFF